jgi:hypothetical protein
LRDAELRGAVLHDDGSAFDTAARAPSICSVGCGMLLQAPRPSASASAAMRCKWERRVQALQAA